MMEDDSVKLRKEAVKRIDYCDKNLTYVIKKTQDVDSSVRHEVYRQLIEHEVDFDKLDH